MTIWELGAAVLILLIIAITVTALAALPRVRPDYAVRLTVTVEAPVLYER